MNDNVFRWLHLSDFHVGLDSYGQRCLFEYIIQNVKEQVDAGTPPDAVFITGDIADTGKADEYKQFFDEFFWPMLGVLQMPDADRIFMVPGNHDVDRSKSRAVRIRGLLSHAPMILDPTIDAQSDRALILPRFKAFTENDLTGPGTTTSHWIESPEGVLVSKFNIRSIQVGVLGFNSAWLSCDDNDRNELSPGKALLEEGLKELSETDLNFVIGHHPIEWFLDDELPIIRTMLARTQSIYLHGHLHKTGGQTLHVAASEFLPIQAGASFQAHDNEIWFNRIVWAEADVEASVVRIRPKLWSRDHMEWVLDTTAFPQDLLTDGMDAWEVPLPKKSTRVPPQKKAGEEPLQNRQPVLPIGWRIIDKDVLEELRTPLSEDDIVSFFDGRVPSWKDALSSDIPRRTMVSTLVTQIQHWTENPHVSVLLVRGAGGEGKSTILRQAIVELLEQKTIKQVMWNETSEGQVPVLDDIPEGLGPWVIASDDAEIIGNQLFRIISQAARKGRTRICLLLSFRDTDWIAAKCNQLLWHSHAQVDEYRLRGLTPEDAEAVVNAWTKYDRRGLGRLYGQSKEVAVKTLLTESQNESDSDEGAFLGAMLRTRFGDGIKDHVKNLLLSLDKCEAPGGTLSDAFAYIAVPHAENVLTLSKGVLARALGCSRGRLKTLVLGPLGEEAAIVPTGQFVLTRHRAIAETATDILSKDFHLDTDEIILSLMKAALELSDEDEFVPNLASWRFLSTHFFNADKKELGVRLAKAAHDHDRTNPFFIVQLAKLLRMSYQSEMSVEIFRNALGNVKRDRTFYFEWAISEGVLGNRCCSIWLAAASLADNTAQAWPDVEDALKVFAGMGTTFGKLYELFDDRTFIEGCSATAQLGQSIKHKTRSEEYFQEAAGLAREAGVDGVTLTQAFARFIQGVVSAWKRREANLSEWLKDAPDLNYNRLLNLLHLDVESESPAPPAQQDDSADADKMCR